MSVIFSLLRELVEMSLPCTSLSLFRDLDAIGRFACRAAVLAHLWDRLMTRVHMKQAMSSSQIHMLVQIDKALSLAFEIGPVHGIILIPH